MANDGHGSPLDVGGANSYQNGVNNVFRHIKNVIGRHHVSREKECVLIVNTHVI